MIGQLTNFNNAAVGSCSFFVGETPIRLKSSQWRVFTAGPVFSVETSVRIELSLVPEVEHVFFERKGEGEFRIISIVNRRDAAIREKVYAREEAIMSLYPGLNFDFHVIARMDRNLEDVMTKAGKPVFER